VSLGSGAYFTERGYVSASNFSGTLGIGNGGTNNTSYTSGKFLAFDGTELASTAFDQTSFAAASGSGNYIQNGTSQQTASLNVSGSGAFGTTVSATTVSATTGNITSVSATTVSGTNVSASGTLTVPVSGGAAPTASGSIAYDSTANKFKVGVNSASNTLALLGGGNAFTLGKQTLAASAATFASLNFPNSGVTPTTPAPAIGDMWLTTGDPHLQFQSAAGTTKSLAFTTDVGGGTVGGDLSGTVSNATVAKVNGVTYGATPSTNTIPVVTASNTVTYEQVPNSALANSSTSVNGQTCTLGGSCTVTATPSGAAGGDLSGSYPSPKVAQINGSPLGTTTGAGTGQVLGWNGSSWVPQTVTIAAAPAILSGWCAQAMTSFAGTTFGSFLGFGVLTNGGPNSQRCQDLSITTPTANNVFGIPLPSAGTIRNLRVVSSVAGNAGTASVFTVYKNGGSNSITCTIGNGATTCGDATNNFSVVAGDTVAVLYQGNNGLANIRVSLEKQ
jgi:hypothetical protein